MKQVKVLEANLVLEDRVEPHHVNDIVSLTDEQYARIPADQFGVAVADVATGGSSLPWPRVRFRLTLPFTVADGHLHRIDPDGTDTLLDDAGADLGVDWLRWKNQDLYVKSDRRVLFTYFIYNGGAADSYFQFSTSGRGGAIGWLPGTNIATLNSQVMGSGSFDGTPATAESGDYDESPTEAGWDAVGASVGAGITTASYIEFFVDD